MGSGFIAGAHLLLIMPSFCGHFSPIPILQPAQAIDGFLEFSWWGNQIGVSPASVPIPKFAGFRYRVRANFGIEGH
jgi:hypothetical protein